MFLSLFAAASVAMAAPEFSIVDAGAPSPIEGVVFNPEALSEILVAPDRIKQECEIEWTRTLDKQKNESKLELDKEAIRYSSLLKKHNVMLIEKDTEITTLQETIKKQSPTNKWIWLGIGLVGGGALYYGTDRALDSVLR